MIQTRLVLFDIDGPLLHSGGCGRAATRLALQEVFGTTGILDKVDFAGKTDWQILHEALLPAGFTEDQISAKIGTYHEAVTGILRQIIKDFPVRPCPGAPTVVTALHEDPQVMLGLVTGNMAGLVPVKLQAAGYDPALFVVGAYGSEGWDRSMLPPLALARAQAHSGVTFAPDRVVIVGDTPGDIRCAASIGARTVAVATGPFSVQELHVCGPNVALESLADTTAALHAIMRNHHRH